jgi:hypothetical protein
MSSLRQKPWQLRDDTAGDATGDTPDLDAVPVSRAIQLSTTGTASATIAPTSRLSSRTLLFLQMFTSLHQGLANGKFKISISRSPESVL